MRTRTHARTHASTATRKHARTHACTHACTQGRTEEDAGLPGGQARKVEVRALPERLQRARGLPRLVRLCCLLVHLWHLLQAVWFSECLRSECTPKVCSVRVGSRVLSGCAVSWSTLGAPACSSSALIVESAARQSLRHLLLSWRVKLVLLRCRLVHARHLHIAAGLHVQTLSIWLAQIGILRWLEYDAQQPRPLLAPGASGLTHCCRGTERQPAVSSLAC